MIRVIKRSIGTVCLIVMMPFNAMALDFTWLIDHRPPYRIWHEDNSVSGLMIDTAQKAFDQAGVTYKFEKSNSSRTYSIIENNHIAACAAGWFKTPEREKFAKYTSEFYRSRGIAVMTRKNNKEVHAHKSFDSLFSDETLKFGHRKSWSYGSYIDSLRLTYNTPTVTHNQSNEGAVHLMLGGEFDYFLVTLETGEFFINSIKKGRDILTILQMEDTPPSPPRYIMCSQKVDDKVIEKINKALESN